MQTHILLNKSGPRNSWKLDSSNINVSDGTAWMKYSINKREILQILNKYLLAIPKNLNILPAHLRENNTCEHMLYVEKIFPNS